MDGDMSKVLLMTIATGKYHQFIDPLVSSSKEYFLKDHDVDFLVFCDYPEKVSNEMYTSVWYHRPWPYPTLLRYHAFLTQKDFISK